MLNLVIKAKSLMLQSVEGVSTATAWDELDCYMSPYPTNAWLRKVPHGYQRSWRVPEPQPKHRQAHSGANCTWLRSICMVIAVFWILLSVSEWFVNAAQVNGLVLRPFRWELSAWFNEALEIARLQLSYSCDKWGTPKRWLHKLRARTRSPCWN